MADKSADGSFSKNNISQSNSIINSNVLSNTKYSMQNNKKTQELEDSPFSLYKNAKHHDDLIKTNYI